MTSWLTDGVLQLDTDYPAVADFPMWLYVVRGRDRAAVIDTGVVTTYDAVAGRQLADAGVDVHEVGLVVNTHGHPDHFGGNHAWLAASPAAEVAAPAADLPWVEDHQRHWDELWAGYPGCLAFDDATRDAILDDYCGPNTAVGVTVRDQTVLDLGGRELLAVRTGGHSPDHTAYFDTTDRILFTGDVVQAEGQPFLTAGTLAPMYTDPDDYRGGLRLLRELDFSWLVPAHAQPLTAAAGRALIEQSLRYVDRVEEVVEQLLAEAGERPVTTAAVATAIGELTGTGVTLQNTAVATAHLRRHAANGELLSAWVRADG